MIYEGQGNVINFEEMKKKLKDKPYKANTSQDQQKFDKLQAGANRIGDVLAELNLQMIAIPKMEIIAPGVFRLMAELVIREKQERG